MHRSVPGPRAALGLSCAVALAACSVEPPLPPVETVFTLQPATWFEDGWSVYEVSPDGGAVIFGSRFGRRLFDLERGTERAQELLGGLDRLGNALYSPDGRLWRRGARGEERGWFDPATGAASSALPEDAAPRFSPDGSLVAYYRGTAGSGASLFVGTPGDATEYDLGGRVTEVAWAPDGKTLYATIFREDGVSALFRLGGDDEAPELVRDGLDGLARFNRMAVSEDGASLYLALAGGGPPDPEARHRPDADRDTDIYRLELSSGALDAVVTVPGDDLAPQIVNGHLYWTHNEYLDIVTIVPVDGGEPRDIVRDAQIPYWSADGRQIAFTVGGWQVADWALNMDAWVVDVDEVGDRLSEPGPLIVGYHEDFTPAWSPDGRWLAYHSHRSALPVSHYFADGGTDDIYLRRVDAPMADEIRLMDFGWEVGVADWDRTGTRLFFDSWERGGRPGASHPWVATIDTTTGRATAMDALPLPEGFGGTVLAAWSPVADELAVVERIGGDRHSIWLMGPTGSNARRLFEYRASTYGGVDWTPDGARLIYGGLAEDRMQLFSYDLAAGESKRLTTGTDDVIQPQVSPDGRWIAASRLTHVKQLRRMPIG